MEDIHTDNEQSQESDESNDRNSKSSKSTKKSRDKSQSSADTRHEKQHKSDNASSALVKKWQKLVAKHDWQPSTLDAVDFFNSSLNVLHYSDLDSEGDEDDERRPGSKPDSLREPRTIAAEQAVTIEHDELHLQPTRYLAAAHCPPANNNALVTTTSYSTVSVEEKIDDLSKLWSPEEDGLYVGSPPACPATRWAALERRLLAADKTKWFRSDGSAAVLADPLRPYLVRNVVQPLPEASRPAYAPTKPSGGLGDTVNRYGGRQLDHVYPLHIFVSRLAFGHHWLFGDEDVLASRLRRLWSSYCAGDGDNNRDRPATTAKMDALVRKLRALYRAHDDAVELIDQLQFNGADSGVVSAQLKRIASYREAIAATRDDYYTLSGQRRRLVRELLAAWKELKAVRKRQGFAGTRCRLIVKKGEAAAAADQTEPPLDWDEEVRRQMDESRRRFRDQVQADADRYRRQKAEWKAHKKRLKKSRRQSTESEVNDDEIVEEPEPPEERDFDEEDVRDEIVKSMEESLAPPGEKPVKLSLVEDDKTLTGKPDAREERRIEALKKVCYQIKIYFNQEERAASDVFRLSEDFLANIQQAFNVWIREKPRNLSIQILYKLNAANKKWIVLTQIPLKIPSQSTGFATVQLDELEFTSDAVHPPVSDMGTVGSTDKSSDSDGNDSQIRGLLSCKVGWGSDSQGNVFAPNLSTNQMRSDGQSSKDWIKEIELDPNDPNNAEMFEKLEKLKRMESKGFVKEGSTESPTEDPDVFCSQEALDSNVRFKVLQLRANDKKPFCLMSMVPSRSSEIPKNLQQMIELGSQQSLQSQEDEDDMNPLDAIRCRGKRKIMTIYQNVADKISASSQKKLNLADLVMEDHIPDMTTFGGQLMPLLFKPNRPLRPERRERTPVPFLAGLAIHSSDPLFLSVSVVRALNVPEKVEVSSAGEPKSTVAIHPFVEVTFQKQSARTTAGKGCSPTWNQELRLPVQFPEGSRSMAGLQSIQDDLFIQLFDEILVDILDDDRLRDLSIHQRYERHWLGGFRIPFQVVFKWSKVEGTFALNVPLAPIGYQYDKQNNNGPLLTVLISITPAISPPRIDLPNGASLEDQSLVDHINSWRSQLVKGFPHLAAGVNPLVINDQGLSVYVGRYLHALEPPEQLKGSDEAETIKNLFQFVASIPPMACSQPNIPHVWLTCDVALKTMAAGDEERAVLLFNYLRALEYDAYILLGMSIPHGDTAYVLYHEKNSQSMRLINPTTGHSLDVKDSTSSLQQVWVLFNQHDFWANTQTRVHPSQLSYQVSKASDWRPLFSRRFPNPQLSSVQIPESIQYFTTSKKQVRQLEDTIIEHVRQTFMKWRKTQRTKWNRHASQVLRELLEKTARDDIDSSSPNLEHLRDTYKVFGVPLKTPYTNVETLSDMLFATGLHRHQGNEFALAVHIKPFPNNFLQAFLYCAYLEAI